MRPLLNIARSAHFYHTFRVRATTSNNRTENLIAALLIGSLCLWAFIAYKNWHFDDALIVNRISHNLISHGQWAYNVGEKLNASTSALNTLLVAALSLGGMIPILTSSHLVTAFSLIIVGWILYKHVFRDVPGYISAGASCAALLSLATNSTWGLESNLFIALSLLALSLPPGGFLWGLAYGAVILTRPDGALLFAIHASLIWYKTRQLPIIGILSAGALLFPWLVYSQLSFGSFFPDTLSNKMWQGRSGYWGHGRIYIKAFIDHLLSFGTIWILAVPFCLIGLYGFIVSRSSFLIFVLFAAVQQIVYGALNVPGYHWYFASIDFVTVALALYGLGRLVATVIPQKSAILFPFLVAIFGGLSLFGTNPGDKIDGRDRAYKEVVSFISDNKLDTGSIALIEVGTIGFDLLGSKIVDLLGLTSFNPEFITDKNLDLFFGEPPSLIVLHDPVWHFESAIYNDLRFRISYEKLGVSGAAPFSMAVYSKKLGDVTSVEEYINANYHSFKSGKVEELLPPATSNRALCIVDLVNGVLARGGEISVPKGPLTFKGWAVVNDEKSLSDGVSVVLHSTSRGEAYEVVASRHEREDVAKHLNVAEFKDAGFAVDAHSLGMNPGAYRVSLVQQIGSLGIKERCDAAFVVVVR